MLTRWPSSGTPWTPRRSAAGSTSPAPARADARASVCGRDCADVAWDIYCRATSGIEQLPQDRPRSEVQGTRPVYVPPGRKDFDELRFEAPRDWTSDSAIAVSVANLLLETAHKRKALVCSVGQGLMLVAGPGFALTVSGYEPISLSLAHFASHWLPRIAFSCSRFSRRAPW